MNPSDLSASQLAIKDASRLALIWESTQAIIAVALTLASIYAALRGIVSEDLSNAFFIIVGFYFGRLISKNVSPQTTSV